LGVMWDKDSVKQLRNSLDLTQMEFADLLGCRQQTISEWELGLYAPANAYGKLLSQIKQRAPLSEKAQPQIQSEVAVWHKNEQEFLEEPQYERPFDPAID
jgi:DNA-binding XRE family transcriptional regulator